MTEQERIDKAVAEERERCARVAESHVDWTKNAAEIAVDIANRIRGEVPPIVWGISYFEAMAYRKLFKEMTFGWPDASQVTWVDTPWDPKSVLDIHYGPENPVTQDQGDLPEPDVMIGGEG